MSDAAAGARSDEPKDTRLRILEAALDLFSTQGYAATSMRQLARRVGVRESAIYSHFKAKQEILDTLFHHYGPGQAVDRILRIDKTELVRNPREVLNALVQSGVAQWTRPEEAKLFRLGMMEHMVCAAGGSVPATQRVIAELMERMTGLFALLVRERVLVDRDPDFLLAQFMGPLLFMRQECTVFRFSRESIEKLHAFCAKHVDFFLEKTLRTKETP